MDQKYALSEPRETKVSIVGWKIFLIAARCIGNATININGALIVSASHDAKR